ncbi:MAG: HTTM domain-containing protein [Kofleriaceae bacterium]
MTRVWSAWVELWDRREDAAALAATRILVALVVLYDLVEIGRLGLVNAIYSPAPLGFGVAYDGWASALELSPQALWWIAVIAAAAIATGTATRLACVVFVAVSVQLGEMSPASDRGIDSMIRIVLCILALSRCHARWSVDAWLRRRIGRPLACEVPAWPRYLLLLQLVWIYCSGGLSKTDDAWGPPGFTALANVLADPHFARFDPGWLETALPMTRVATAVTISFEISAPIYLALYYFAETRDRPGRIRRTCNRWRLRHAWLAIGILFHLGIAIGLRLGIFAWGMLAMYPALLLPSELARLTGSRRSRPS